MTPVAESLNHDLGKVREWCGLWGMKLNVRKTKSLSLQVTHNSSQSPPLTVTIGGMVVKECDDLDNYIGSNI